MSLVKYRPSIDGMRAIAVTSVFLFHLHNGLLPGGFVGVDIFFVISGFLITTIVYTECREEDFNFLRFYQRRISRIFPVFFLVSAVILIAAYLLYTEQDFASAGALAAASALSAANLKLMFQGNYFQVSPDAQPFLHFWSLSLEEQFYLFLPLTIFSAHKLGVRRRGLIVILGAGALLSFAFCIILTRINPTWAFYLLPARMWELLAGSFLAVVTLREYETELSGSEGLLSLVGLICVVASILLIHEGDTFPGCAAALPVAGTLLLLGQRHHPRQLTERLLSLPAVTAIGKASYSLYLWHWPVYCFVDYSLYSQPVIARTLLKVGLTVALSATSYLWFEKPARRYLNRPTMRAKGFVGFAVVACFLIVAGLSIRSSNYVDASVESASNGGIVFNPSVKHPVVVLMGDSNASMYGRTMKRVAAETNVRLHVISVAAGDPFPNSELYRRSLQFLAREKPDVTVFIAAWGQKIGGDHVKLSTALSEMLKYTCHVILVTQPPLLPDDASRDAIRKGGWLPFFEEQHDLSSRKSANSFLLSLQSDRVHVLDVEPIFMRDDGQVRFVDRYGRQMYQDKGHLSGLGASMVGDLLSAEVSRITAR
jgi:peptidoglycan/LPS O-acetylase OafA/YrhL